MARTAAPRKPQVTRNSEAVTYFNSSPWLTRSPMPPIVSQGPGKRCVELRLTANCQRTTRIAMNATGRSQREPLFGTGTTYRVSTITGNNTNALADAGDGFRGDAPQADAVGDADAIEVIAREIQIRKSPHPTLHFFNFFLMTHDVLGHRTGPATNRIEGRRCIHAHDVAEFGPRKFHQLVVAFVQRIARHEAAHHNQVVGNTIVELPVNPGACLHVLALALGHQESEALHRVLDIGPLIAKR